jgi:hypothetical protein
MTDFLDSKPKAKNRTCYGAKIVCTCVYMQKRYLLKLFLECGVRDTKGEQWEGVNANMI